MSLFHSDVISELLILHFFTFTERLGAIPGPVLCADERGGPAGVHGETR